MIISDHLNSVNSVVFIVYECCEWRFKANIILSRLNCRKLPFITQNYFPIIRGHFATLTMSTRVEKGEEKRRD